VAQLKQAIARFEEGVSFEDGRSGPELRSVRSIHLEVGR